MNPRPLVDDDAPTVELTEDPREVGVHVDSCGVAFDKGNE